MLDASGQHVHTHAVRVYYEDTDAGGIVYYANYLKYAERARTELLRHHGIENGALMRSDRIAFCGVKSCSADYIKPARLDDALEVRTAVTRLGGASLHMHQDICLDSATVGRHRCTFGVHGHRQWCACALCPMVVRDALRQVL